MLNFDLNWIQILKIDHFIFDSMKINAIISRIGGLLRTIFFYKPNIPDQHFDTKILFFKSMNRKDYNENFKELSELTKNKVILDIEYIKSDTLRLYPFYIIIKYLPLLIYTNIGFNLLKMTYLIICQIKYLEIAEKVYKNDFTYLIVYSDMQAIDNMLCQIAKNKAIPTITLQHGLYVDYEKVFNVNIVNYQNHIADYFLSWGKDTNDLINKYHKNSNLFICGKPLKAIGQRSIKNYFTVVFDQNIFHKHNKILLAIAYLIAKKFSLKINLKLHPNNKISWYDIDNRFIIYDEDMYFSRFVIGHTTSMLYELMRLDVPAYKFRSEVPANKIDEEFQFSSVDELFAKIKNHDDNDFNFSEYAKRYITYIGDESIEKYRNFFRRLENGEI